MKCVADLLDRIEQLILDDERAGLTIFHDVANLRAQQPEIDRDGDETHQCRCGVDLEPLDAVEGKDADPIALGEAETRQRIGETARTLIPSPESHRPFKIARPDFVGERMSMHAEHDPQVRQLSHLILLHDQANTVPVATGPGNA